MDKGGITDAFPFRTPLDAAQDLQGFTSLPHPRGYGLESAAQARRDV